MDENQKKTVQALGIYLQHLTYELLNGNELTEEDALTLHDLDYVFKYRQFREIIVQRYSTK